MKIAYILDTFPSLTETFIAREIAALRRRGFSIEAFALRAGEGAHAIGPVSLGKRVGGAFERLTTGRAKPAYFQEVGAAWWLSLKQQAEFQDIEHVHAGWASHPAFIAWGAAKAAGLPWSFSGHARDLFVEGAALSDKLEAAQFAAACTRVGQQFLQQQAPAYAAKVLYVPHGLDLNDFTFQEPALDDGMRFLSVGRLVEKKGFSVLLNALAILKQQRHAFQATIIGDGPLSNQLSQRSHALGLKANVTFTGAQSHEGVRAVMATANCFVLPALMARDGDRDGLPNVLLEAAACGLPIVSTRTGGITDFLDDSTGYLCEANHAEALATTLHHVFDDKSAALERCHAARRRVETDYDIEHNIEPLTQAFQPDYNL